MSTTKTHRINPSHALVAITINLLCVLTSRVYSLELGNSETIQLGSVLSLKDRHSTRNVSFVECLSKFGRYNDDKDSECSLPCSCEIVGSVSPKCDKLTGQCSCKIGFTGLKCSQCSTGYYNNSNNIQGTQSIGWHCTGCDECYYLWYRNVSQLKEVSVEAMKKAHSVIFNLTIDPIVDMNSMGRYLDSGDSNTASTSNASLSDLETKLAVIGERVVENKQNSDQINTLVYEVKSTSDSLKKNREEYNTQKSDLERNVDRMFLIDLNLRLQDEILVGLDASVEGLKRGQVMVQEFMSRGAIKLIIFNRDRTRKALNDSLDFRQHAMGGQLLDAPRSFEYLTRQVSMGQKQVETITAELFNKMSVNFNLSRDQYGLGDICQQRSLNRDSTAKRAEILRHSAKFLIDKAAFDFDNYLVQYDSRTNELESAKRHIELTREIINSTNHSLDRFAINVSMTLKLIATSISSKTPYTRLTSLQIIENVCQMVRTSLDKIDAKATAAKSELGGLWKLQQDLSVPAQIQNLTAGIQLIKLPIIEIYSSIEDFDEAKNLSGRTKFLVDSLQRLNQNFAEYASLRIMIEETNKLVCQIESQNKDETTNSIGQERVQEQIIETASHNQLSTIIKGLNQNIRIKLGGVSHLHSSTTKLNVLLKHELKQRSNNLMNVNLMNRKLYLELKAKYNAVSDAPVSKDEEEANTSNNATTNLKNKLILTKLSLEFKSIALMLQKNIVATSNLSSDFSDNRKVFRRQKRQLDLLHDEMDRVNKDIQMMSRFYQTC